VRVKSFELAGWVLLALAGCGGGSLQREHDATGGGGIDGGIMTGSGGGGDDAGGAAGGGGGDDAGGAAGADDTGGTSGGTPIVGPEVPVDLAVPGAIPAVGTGTSVAFSGSEYFVVWNDHRATWFGQAIGARVGLDGRMLEPAGFPISEIIGASSDPSVVWDGTNYLVVYERAGSIFGRRFTSGGAPADPVSFPISGSPAGSHSPVAVVNGATTLVAWANVDASVNPYGDTIVGARVIGSAVQDIRPIAIARNSGKANPRAAFGGGNWLVCWQTDYRNSVFFSDSVLCARVDSAGAVLDSTPIHVADGQPGEQERTFMRYPWVASDGSGYVVVYLRTGGNVRPSGLVAARVTSEGVVIDPSGIRIGAGILSSVAFNAGHYQVVFDRGEPVLYGNRFDAATGTALDGPTGAPITGAVGTEPRIFAAGSAFYVTFTSPNPEQGLLGSRLSADPALVDTPAVPLVARSASRQGQPALASDGTNYFAVWVDNRDGSNVIYGARIDGRTGLSLDPAAFQVSPSGIDDAAYPSVSFNGTNYLVVWAQWSAAGEGFYGARIAPDGTNLDPASLPLFLTPTPDFYFPPRTGIDSDGTNWFVAWSWGSYAYGARIAPTGVPLDPRVLVSPTPAPNGDYWNPRVVYGADEGNYLIVWLNDNNDVAGARVSSAGRRIDDLPITTAPTGGQATFARQARLGLAYGAGTFLASNANAHGLGQLTLARYAGPSSVALDCCASDSAIAYDGTWFVLAYAVPTPYATYDIKASRYQSAAQFPGVAMDHDMTDWDVTTGGVVDGPVLAVGNGNMLVAYVRYDPALRADRLQTRLLWTR